MNLRNIFLLAVIGSVRAQIEPRLKCVFTDGDLRTVSANDSHTLSPLFLGHIQTITGFAWSCALSSGSACWDKSS